MPQKKQETKEQSFEQSATTDAVANSIDDNEMNALLADLVESKYWKAIVRYNRIVDANTLNSLASLDPFKEPTLVARNQGVRIGLYYLEQTAARERDERRKEEEGTK